MMTFERTKIIKGHVYRYLVKSIRLDGKVKQVFVKYLGKVPDEETADPLDITGGDEQTRTDTKAA